MKEQVTIFENAQFGQIRTSIGANGEPLFCLVDVCRALDLSNPRDVKKRLSQKGVCITDTPTNGGIQQLNFITEPNLYKCIFQSRKKEAEQFQDWVCGEVLPSIRKSGGYMLIHQDETPEQIMARALMLAKETIDRQQAKLAKIIKQNGVEIGQNRLFNWLRDNGYLCKKGELYNQPTQKALQMGLFEIKKTVITKPNGNSLVTTTTKVTGKGQIYFVNKFLYDSINEAELAKQATEQAKKGGAL